MRRIVVKYKDSEQVLIYNIVSFKTDKRQILIENVREFLTNPRIESYEIVDILERLSNPDKESKPYESKYERENNKLPKAIAHEVTQVATTLKGCTKETVDKWNKHLDFNLHAKLNGEYGFTGAKRLYNIFGL
jgi:hypothetical protein